MKSDRHFIEHVIRQVTYKNWNFELNFTEETPSLQVSFYATCSKTGVRALQKGRKWRLSYFMTKNELVNTCFLAVKTCEEHEFRELFKYSGQSIYGPHFNVDLLARLCEYPEHLDGRPEVASA